MPNLTGNQAYSFSSFQSAIGLAGLRSRSDPASESRPGIYGLPGRRTGMSTSYRRRRSGQACLARIAGLATCVALVMVGCSSTPGPTTTVGSGTTTATGSAPTPSALKPIDPAAFQTVVDAAAKKLLVPGAMVLLRTPQGNFRRDGRHHQAGRADATGRQHSFPDRLEHQDHDGGADRAPCPGRQAQVQRPGVHLRPRCAQRREHHHRRAVEDAQRAL